MKRIFITGAALLAIVPASLGLIGNASFAQNVPVRVPSQASVLDDHGGLIKHAEPGDDNGGLATHAEPGDDKSGSSASSSSAGASTGTTSTSGDGKMSDSSAQKVDDGGHGSGGQDDGSGHS